MKKSSISLLCGMLMWGVTLSAQNTTTEVINVEKSYTPQVKSSQKVQLSPTRTSSESEKLPVTYITDTQSSRITSATQPISGMLLPQEETDNTYYPNYIKAGVGYNLSTLLQAYGKASLGKTSLWGKVNHDRGERGENAVNDDKSVYSHTDVSVGASRAIGSYDAGVEASYGYNAFSNNAPFLSGDSYALPLVDKFENTSFSGSVFVKSRQEGKLFDRIVVNAGHFDGVDDRAETYVDAAARFNIKIRHWDISLDAKWAYYDEKYSVIDDMEAGDDMMLFSAVPQISYRKGNFDASVGVRIEAVGGSMDGAEFHIMPEAHAGIGMMDGAVNIYGDFTSGVNMNTLKELTYLNPYLSPYSAPLYSLERLKIKAGVTATVSKALKFDVNASYGKTEQAPVWIFAYDAPQYITVADDIDVFSAEFSGKYSISKIHHTSVFVQYNSSSSDFLSSASYIPDFRMGASYRGSIMDEKVGLYARLAYNSSSASGHITEDGITEVSNDGYVEYYGEASYKLTPRWSVFLNVNNTIDGRTPVFYGYTPVGFRALVGVKFNF